jgi:uncharacterized protein (DUF1778 family)
MKRPMTKVSKPSTLDLATEDQQRLAQALAKPPEPNDALRRAKAAHARLIQDQPQGSETSEQ